MSTLAVQSCVSNRNDIFDPLLWENIVQFIICFIAYCNARLTQSPGPQVEYVLGKPGQHLPAASVVACRFQVAGIPIKGNVFGALALEFAQVVAHLVDGADAQLTLAVDRLLADVELDAGAVERHGAFRLLRDASQVVDAGVVTRGRPQDRVPRVAEQHGAA